MRSFGLILGSLFLGASAFGSTLHIQSAAATDAAGTAIAPKLGEPFWVTIRYTADQDANGAMTVSTPWAKVASPIFRSYAGNRQATYGPITPLFDGPIPVTVSVGDSGPTNFTVSPAEANGAIEYFNSQSLSASFQSVLTFKPGAKLPTVKWVVPQPPAFGFQQVFLTRAASAQLVAADVLQVQNIDRAGLTFQTNSSSVRVSARRLSLAKFADLKKAPKDIKPYTASETLIESGDKTIKSFVASVLPKNFDKTMSVYDASKALYQAVISRVSYVHFDGGSPSAVWTLRNGYGDCGYFSSLFVAACRQAGIPARPVTGFLEGTNQWHVWAEFYVPNAGWVPVDPSFADGLDPQGKFALYFGVIPDLNRRIATSIGFDHSFSKTKVPLLQSPMVFTDASKVSSFSSTCNLSLSANP